MNEQLKILYQSVILKHDKAPFHFEKRENATHILLAYNEICGDRFELFFEIKNGLIKEAYFHGFGCAISKASTSVLIKKILNQPVTEVKELIDLFLKNITGEGETHETTDEELTAFFAARDFPARLKCATLAWEEMEEFFNGERGKW